MNYIICHSDSDPIQPYIGKWYYWLSEYYLGTGSVLIALGVMGIGYILKTIISTIFAKKEKIN